VECKQGRARKLWKEDTFAEGSFSFKDAEGLGIQSESMILDSKVGFDTDHLVQQTSFIHHGWANKSILPAKVGGPMVRISSIRNGWAYKDWSCIGPHSVPHAI
jgi:hypothetical protein